MRQRWLLIAILAAAEVAAWSITRIPSVVERSGIQIRGPGIVGLVILVLALSGNRFAWALCFVGVVFIVAITLVMLIRDPDPANWALTGLQVAVALTLWGLKPEEPFETSAPRNQG